MKPTRVAMEDSKYTAEQIAEMVTRRVNVVDKTGKPGKPVMDADNNPVTTDGPVSADEIMSWAEYPDRGEVTVVTKSGEKLTGKLAAKAAPKK